jgi:hypothetical protein
LLNQTLIINRVLSAKQNSLRLNQAGAVLFIMSQDLNNQASYVDVAECLMLSRGCP